MKQRNITLDLAKGFLIILVVLGHSIQYSFGSEWLTSTQFFDDITFKTIYSFHMPLFMLISGFLFYNSNKKDFKTLIFSKLKVIGIPMLSFILLCNSLYYLSMVIHGNILGIFTHYFKTIFFGGTMWFLLSLLLNMIVVAILTRLFKKKSSLYLGIFFLFVASLFIPDSFILNVHKFMFPFFCIGYLLRQNEVSLYSFSPNKVVLGIFTILSVLAILWFDKDTYIYTSGFCILGDYTHQFLTDCKRMLIALVVSYTYMQYVHLFARHRNILVDKVSRIGQISLFIYGMNMFFDIYYPMSLAVLSVNLDFNYWLPIVITAVFIPICSWLYKLLERIKFTRTAFLGK